MDNNACFCRFAVVLEDFISDDETDPSSTSITTHRHRDSTDTCPLPHAYSNSSRVSRSAIAPMPSQQMNAIQAQHGSSGVDSDVATGIDSPYHQSGDPYGQDGAPGGDMSMMTMIRTPSMQQRGVVSRRMRTSIVARHRLLRTDELLKHVLVPATQCVSIPILYPQNVIAWSHLRMCTMDIGRSYYYRIMLFTSFFAIFVLFSVLFLFFIVSEGRVRTYQNVLVRNNSSTKHIACS
jgi:uncharacterized membrane protein